MGRRIECFMVEPTGAFQENKQPLYHRPGVQGEFTLRDAPDGAIWDCYWFPDECKGPDGKCLCIMTPAGEWLPDMSPGIGDPWQRTGVAPKLTITPSIRVHTYPHSRGKFHGLMTDGFLEEIGD